MIPKPIYEILPGLYTAAAIFTLSLNDSALRYFPAGVLILTAVSVIYMRYEFRHIPEHARSQRPPEKSTWHRN